MTNQEALLRFNVAYDAIATTSAPPLEPQEVAAVMNNALMDLITALGNARVFDKLREITLVEKLSLAVCTLESLGSYAYQSTSTLTSTFLYHVDSHLKVTSRTTLVTVSNDWLPCEEINRSIADFYVQTPMNQQIILHPKVLIHYNDSTNKYTPIVFIDSNTTISTTETFELSYVRMPTLIDLTNDAADFTEFGNEMEQLIINKAVQLAIVATDQDRLKLALDKEQKAQQQQRRTR